MFVLRQQQMEAFQKLGEKQFTEAMLAHLKAASAESVEGLPDPEIRRRIDIGRARAARYALLRQDHLTAFISLMFQIAPNFDEQRVIHQILKPIDVPAEDRIERLSSQPSPEDWLEAEEAADPSVWSAKPPQPVGHV